MEPPKKLYELDDWKHSCGEDFDKIIGKATWKNVSPERKRLCFASFRALCEMDGDWTGLFECWRSLIAVKGHLLFNKDAPHLGGIMINDLYKRWFAVKGFLLDLLHRMFPVWIGCHSV